MKRRQPQGSRFPMMRTRQVQRLQQQLLLRIIDRCNTSFICSSCIRIISSSNYGWRVDCLGPLMTPPVLWHFLLSFPSGYLTLHWCSNCTGKCRCCSSTINKLTMCGQPTNNRSSNSRSTSTATPVPSSLSRIYTAGAPAAVFPPRKTPLICVLPLLHPVALLVILLVV